MKKLIFFFILCIAFSFLFSCPQKDKIIPDFDSATFNTTAAGCASFFVYKFNGDQNLALTVNGEREALGLSTTEQTFELNATAGLNVGIAQFDGAATNHYCDDVVEENEPEIIHTWEGLNGIARIQITEDSISFSEWEVIYKISVKLENIEFLDSDANSQELESAEFLEVVVGWLPG